MKNILLVIDMQVDFVDGALGSAEAQAIVPAVARRIDEANERGERIIFTYDTHTEDYMNTHEGSMLPVIHCVRGTAGWQLAPAIEQAAARCGSAERVEKPTFGSVALARQLAQEAEAEGLICGRGMRVELCGLCTDICVVSNALLLRAALPEAEIYVNPALCAGVTPEKHNAAIETMASCQIRLL